MSSEPDWSYDSESNEITLVVPPDVYESTETIFLSVGYEGSPGLRGTIFRQRRKGHWVDNETSYADGVVQTCDCSECGRRSTRPLGDFCRWCSAFME